MLNYVGAPCQKYTNMTEPIMHFQLLWNKDRSKSHNFLTHPNRLLFKQSRLSKVNHAKYNGKCYQ